MNHIYCLMGKGGVGKTTLSVELAHLFQLEGRRVCIMGLDQQHNAADVIKDRGYDLEYHGLFQWQKMSENVEFIVETTFMRRYKQYVPLVAPDFITIASLGELLVEKGDFDEVVVDFPPNHAALTMMSVPNVMESMVWKAVTLKNRLHKLVKGHDRTLALIDHLYSVIKQFKDFLATKACFLPVVAPSALALAEAFKLVDFLKSLGYDATAYILNMFPAGSAGCSRCAGHVAVATSVLEELLSRGKKIVVVKEGDYAGLRDLVAS